MKDFINELIKSIKEKKPDKDELAKLKIKLAGKYKLKKIPTDIEIFLNLDEDAIDVEKFLITKPTRTISGVAIIAVRL